MKRLGILWVIFMIMGIPPWRSITGIESLLGLQILGLLGLLWVIHRQFKHNEDLW